MYDEKFSQKLKDFIEQVTMEIASRNHKIKVLELEDKVYHQDTIERLKRAVGFRCNILNEFNNKLNELQFKLNERID